MEYWRVEWHHDFGGEPVLFFHEIGPDRWETRRVQGYQDGRLLRADAGHEAGDVLLAEVPFGDIADVAAQEEFSARVIDRHEFEAVWRRARWPASGSGGHPAGGQRPAV
ncbi:hypothetical protein GCM10010420_42980 [Streptomyces glaucosporus]|uniref:DUF6881 domain-containing protein n=2 Tax=Streptomyces glaucosporus TaxID=284044 RepID=A0ABP5VR42_9ACTN